VEKQNEVSVSVSPGQELIGFSVLHTTNLSCKFQLMEFDCQVRRGLSATDACFDLKQIHDREVLTYKS